MQTNKTRDSKFQKVFWRFVFKMHFVELTHGSPHKRLMFAGLINETREQFPLLQELVNLNWEWQSISCRPSCFCHHGLEGPFCRFANLCLSSTLAQIAISFHFSLATQKKNQRNCKKKMMEKTVCISQRIRRLEEGLWRVWVCPHYERWINFLIRSFSVWTRSLFEIYSVTLYYTFI